MKKILITVAIAAAAATAFAHGYGYGGGYGGGYGMMGNGYGMMGGYGPGYNQDYGGCAGPYYQNDGDEDQSAQPGLIDDAGAKSLVQKYLDENLKGYSITDSIKVEVPRGNMYRFSLKDKSGNQFVMLVNPFGYLRGPIPVKSVN